MEAISFLAVLCAIVGARSIPIQTVNRTISTVPESVPVTIGDYLDTRTLFLSEADLDQIHDAFIADDTNKFNKQSRTQEYYEELLNNDTVINPDEKAAQRGGKAEDKKEVLEDRVNLDGSLPPCRPGDIEYRNEGKCCPNENGLAACEKGYPVNTYYVVKSK